MNIFFFKGKWSAGIGVTKESTCINCGTGKYGLVTPGAYAKSSCKKCNRGYFLGTVGSYGETSKKSCMACPLGFVQNVTGEAFCLPCTPGSFSNAGGMAECIICTAGKFSSTVARTNECDFCLSGKHQPDNGTTACLNCIPGKHQPLQEQLKCIDCAVGRASLLVARDTNCDACTQGRY